MPADIVPGRRRAGAALRRLARDGAATYTGLEAPLRRAVLLHWGSMKRAREALGLQPLPAPRQRWSRERVIDEVAKLARSGQHMSHGEVAKAGHGDLLLAASKYAGGWVRARSLAGVRFKPNRVASVPSWDATAVIEAIRNRQLHGQPLASSKVPKSLMSAGLRYFGSWRDAIEASGIDYDHVLLLKQVTDAELLEWLRNLARAKPHMTLYDIDKHGEHAVVCRRRWGSFEAAAKAAGLPEWPIRIRQRAMSRSAVVRALRTWNAARKPLRFGEARTLPGGYYLVNSVLHHFRTWNDALVAAGLPTKKQRRLPSHR
jgi:hypothetical protein